MSSYAIKTYLFQIIPKTLFIFFLASISLQLSGQELCDNAIDDDGDGLIDFNDDDCECTSTIATNPVSLIPNPSFEDFSCLPYTFSEMTCADTWIQASDATSDYFNTNGFTGDPFIIPTPPQPIPDGDGFVGFIESFYDGYGYTNGYYEYIGACLTSPMLSGTDYTMQFDLGFGTFDYQQYPYYGFSFISPPVFEICMFGTADCANLPFSPSPNIYGCATDDPNWIQLGCVTVAGEDEWVLTQLQFNPTVDIEAIVLGPGCEDGMEPPGGFQHYMFLDDLTLAESAAFTAPTITQNGNCETISLEVPGQTYFDAQWYLDDIALVGETNLSIDVSNSSAGTYTVVFDNGTDCGQTAPFNFTPPILPEIDIAGDFSFCPGDSSALTVSGVFDDLLWNNVSGNDQEFVSEFGPLTITANTADGCTTDTTIQIVSLTEAAINAINAPDGFCPGDSALIEITGDFDQIFWNNVEGSNNLYVNAEGFVAIEAISAGGCAIDTSIFINAFDEAGVDINEGEGIEVEQGTLVDLSISTLSSDYSLSWTGTDGLSCDNCDNPQFIALNNANIEVFLNDINTGCTASDAFQLSVLPAPLCDVTTPTGFTPNEDGQNDNFTIYTSADCNLMVNVLRVYNRWGREVFINQNFEPNNPSIGWDGVYNGTKSPLGAYAWYAELTDNLGNIEVIKGNVTLIR